MKLCIMCANEFPESELDFCGRCPDCFRTYVALSDDEKPSLGVPWSKKINHDWPEK